jgi:hypothetical protein
MDEVIYLYALTPAPAMPMEAMGVAGAPVQAIPHGTVVGYISRVGVDEFGAKALHGNLNDLDWLERTARSHDAVVARLSASTLTVPVRLATVFRDLAQFHDMLELEQDKIHTLFDHLRGHHEWGVKGFVQPVTNSDEVADETTQNRPGTAYLQRRSAAMSAQQATVTSAREQAERVHAALADIAAASRLRPAHDRRLARRSERMILNASYLVSDERSTSFTDTVHALSNQVLDLELTGPWAPYSFTTLTIDEASVSGTGADRPGAGSSVDF